MADHRGIAILRAFKDLLINLPLVGDNVFSGRVYDLSNVPSHSIYLGPATVDANNTAFSDEIQMVRDEILVVGSEVELDELLLNVHAEAYVAVKEDYTLGLPYVIDTVFDGMSDPEYIDDGKRPALSAVFTWRVTYRHSILDPGA